MPLGGKWLGIMLVVLLLWLAFLCRVWWGLLRQPMTDQRLLVRHRITLTGLGFSIVAVGSLLLLYLSWISVSVSQHLGVTAIRVLAIFLFWPTIVGLLLSAVGSGRKRFWGLGSCLITGLWWLSLAMTSAISMGAPVVRHSTKFLIPANYVGWVEVRYGETTARVLPMNEGTLICQIPADGILVTSTLREQGWAKDEYFYYSEDGSVSELRETGWGRGGMIWGGSDEWQQLPSGSKPAQTTEYFYVGTEERYHHAVSTNERRPINESAIQTVPNSR
jgi:Family of unknown function (DUF6843)